LCRYWRAQRVVPQKRRTECADGPVPRFCFFDAIHRQSVRHPCSVFLCSASASLMAARQAVWRESSHWDASHQHRADTDAAAVVRHCPLSSAAAFVLRFNRACLQERHIQLARRRRVRDSADERQGVCSLLPTPPLFGPTATAAWRTNITSHTASTKDLQTTHFPMTCASTHQSPAAQHGHLFLPISSADLIGPFRPRPGCMQRQPLPTAGDVRGHCRARRPRPKHLYVRAVCVDCGTMLPASKSLHRFVNALWIRRCPSSTDSKCKPRSILPFGRRAKSHSCRPKLS
jgi:hypothetical protein